jgi:hypothetical protein
MKKLILLFCLFSGMISFGQPQQTGGNLTIFSEDGDAFYVVLNGEKQNDEPQANIKIEDLPQPYYSAKIIFEDKTLKTISKSAITITDVDGKMMDVTYKIKKDKNKKVKLVFFSMIPVPLDFIPPAGMYVRQFGQPNRGNDRDDNRGDNGRPRNSGSGSTFGANVNMPGVNLNISINDNDGTQSQHHEGNQHHTSSGSHQQQNNSNTGKCKGLPMSSSDFMDAKKTISQSSFDETKLTAAKSIVSANCISTDQVVTICNLFSFEDNKLEFAKYAYRYTTDTKNYFKVINVFNFSASKEELSEFIQKQ